MKSEYIYPAVFHLNRDDGSYTITFPDLPGCISEGKSLGNAITMAASALKCMGGQMWGRLLFRNDDERGRAAKAGITDLNRIYTRDEMVTADVIFSATGVTNGSIVKGLRREPHFVETETILMRSKTGSVRRMIYRNPVRA